MNWKVFRRIFYNEIHPDELVDCSLCSLEIPADGVGEDPDPPLDVGEHGDDGGGEHEPLPGERVGQQLEDGPLKGGSQSRNASMILVRFSQNSFS